jgi:GntR family transcriptional repressor for pyruvate dehydrogenase complex
LELIHQQGLGVGDKLPNIRQLALMLEVKPTAVRDALLQAQTIGLLRILPRSGAYIQSLTYEPLVEAFTRTIEPALIQADRNLFHLLDARRLLEIELASRAASQRSLEDLLPVRQALESMARIPETERRNDYVEADIRFHTAIARLAGNEVLATIQRALLGLLKPYLVQLPWSPARRQSTDRSHAEIYSALIEGDAERARRAMSEHLDMAYRMLLKEVQSLPEGASDPTSPILQGP